MEDWLILVLGIIMAVVGAFTAIKVVSLRQLDAETVKKTISIKDKYAHDLELECNELESEIKKLRGKANQSKQIPKAMVDEIPSSPEAIDVFIEQNLPTIANALPKEIGGLLLQNKEFVKSYVTKNPDIIKKFITKGSTQAEPESTTRDFSKVTV
jgi:hypothetical protein